MKRLVFLLLVLSGCSFYDKTECDIEYSVLSSVPCEMSYQDEDGNWVTAKNVTDYKRVVHKVYYHDSGVHLKREYLIKERYCLGTIGIKINGIGVEKTIGVSCCCEEELRYSTTL